MPATMSQLLGDRARVTITGANGFSIFVDFRPRATRRDELRAVVQRFSAMRASTHALDELQATDDADTAIRAANEALDTTEANVTQKLAALLLDWDLLDDDGEVIPPTLDGLMTVDYRLQRRILDAIESDNQVGEATGATPSTPSRSHSSRKARRATSRR